MKKFFNLVDFEFKKRKNSLLFWVIGTLAVMFLYVFLFPLMKEMVEMLIAQMGEESLGILAGSSLDSLSNYNLYFASEFQSFFIILCGYACFSAANIFHKELNSGSAEFSYTYKYSRKEIFFAKSFVSLISSVLLLVCCYFACIIGGLIVAYNQINIGALLFSFVILLLPLLFSWALGTFFSAICKKGTSAGGIALGVIVGTYLIGSLASIGPKSLQFLVWFSPIMLLSPIDAVNFIIAGSPLLLWRILFVVLIVCLLFVSSYFIHKKKDL